MKVMGIANEDFVRSIGVNVLAKGETPMNKSTKIKYFFLNQV